MNVIKTSMTKICSDHRWIENMVLLKDCYLYVMHQRPKKGLNYKYLLMGTGLEENKRGKINVRVRKDSCKI